MKAVEQASQDPAMTAAPPAVRHAGPELSVIVPTFNERGNVVELIERLEGVLGEVAWEVVFVDDDSPDGTADLVREIAQQNSRVRCLQRIERRGLSSACIEGMLASSAPYVAVIDGDLQHDESLLPNMLALLRQSEVDIVVGSRYAAGGDISDWDLKRARISRLAGRLSRIMVPADLTDPMSGFFMMRRPVLTASVRRLSAIGFKILADLFASSPQKLRFKELPYRFRPRRAGESKLDSLSAWDFLMLLLDKLVGHVIPVRFMAFSIVGAAGVAVHFAALALIRKLSGASFIEAQAGATITAMTFNFAVNNVLTYRDRQLRGWAWLRGWLSFVLACSIGGFANLGLAKVVYEWGRGWALAAFAGILVGAVWNYAITRMLTWRRPRTVAVSRAAGPN
jgi:dolichol-phosphate mannosyltransferase